MLQLSFEARRFGGEEVTFQMQIKSGSRELVAAVRVSVTERHFPQSILFWCTNWWEICVFPRPSPSPSSLSLHRPTSS